MTLVIAKCSDRRTRADLWSCTYVEKERTRRLTWRQVRALLRAVGALGRIRQGPRRSYYVLSVDALEVGPNEPARTA